VCSGFVSAAVVVFFESHNGFSWIAPSLMIQGLAASNGSRGVGG
jgi:hypothetical protein